MITNVCFFIDLYSRFSLHDRSIVIKYLAKRCMNYYQWDSLNGVLRRYNWRYNYRVDCTNARIERFLFLTQPVRIR